MRALRIVTCVAPLALATAGACSREPGFPDRTARVTVGGRTTTYAVDSCGLDGQTVFVVGRSEGGAVLQAVVGVEPDGETGVPGSTGVSVDDGAESVAAFGEEAWARRGERGDPPGTIETARVRGARIQAGGEALPVDETGEPTADATVPLRLDARCDAEDE